MDLQFDIHTRLDGSRYLHFPFMSFSDIHWLTRQSRAKQLCRVFDNFESDELHLLGDIVDGEYAKNKKTANVGPWHRQGMGHVLRKADRGANVTAYDGNHEVDGWLERLFGKQLYGVQFEGHTRHVDPNGLMVDMEHGDRFDRSLYRSAEQQAFWYVAGSVVLEPLYAFDYAHRGLRPQTEFSLAASLKHGTKEYINYVLGVRNFIHQELDQSQADILIYGHTHMPGFERTPAGKLVINDGSSTEHVQFLVRDAEGHYAVLQFHKDRLLVWEPDRDASKPEVVRWADLGLEHFGDEPILYEDEFTYKADKVFRVAARAWPAQDRQAALEHRNQALKLLENGVYPQVQENILLAMAFDSALNNHALELPVAKRPVRIAPLNQDVNYDDWRDKRSVDFDEVAAPEIVEPAVA